MAVILNMNEADKSKAIERANSYRIMMDSWAWKDFQRFLDGERQSALEIGINSEDMREIQVNRGKARQIDAINNHLGYILSGQ